MIDEPKVEISDDLLAEGDAVLKDATPVAERPMARPSGVRPVPPRRATPAQSIEEMVDDVLSSPRSQIDRLGEDAHPAHADTAEALAAHFKQATGSALACAAFSVETSAWSASIRRM